MGFVPLDGNSSAARRGLVSAILGRARLAGVFWLTALLRHRLAFRGSRRRLRLLRFGTTSSLSLADLLSSLSLSLALSLRLGGRHERRQGERQDQRCNQASRFHDWHPHWMSRFRD